MSNRYSFNKFNKKSLLFQLLTNLQGTFFTKNLFKCSLYDVLVTNKNIKQAVVWYAATDKREKVLETTALKLL